MKEYLGNIVEAVVSIAKGMGVTIRTFFTTTETVQYPDVDVMDPSLPGYKGHLGPVQERFRGILCVEPDSCIADHACERVCPVDCIQIEDLKGPKSTARNLVTGKDVPKARHLTRFDIHIGRCMYCGLCVDQCPTGAIHFTREFAGSTLDYKTFIRKFVTNEEAEKVRKMAAEEEARKKAEEAKKAAEAPAEKPEPDKGGGA